MAAVVLNNCGGRIVSKKNRNLIEEPSRAGRLVGGYAAVRNVSDESEIAQLAYLLFLERERSGREGSADDDWFRAEAEVRRRRTALSA